MRTKLPSSNLAILINIPFIQTIPFILKNAIAWVSFVSEMCVASQHKTHVSEVKQYMYSNVAAVSE